MEKLAYQFIKEIQRFSPSLEKIDPFWEILFPDKNQNWHYIYISEYQNVFTITHSNSDNEDIQVIPNDSVKVKQYFREPDTRSLYEDEKEEWTTVIQAATNWLKNLSEDWLSTTSQLLEEYPNHLKYGTIDIKILASIVPDIESTSSVIGVESIAKIIKNIEADIAQYDKQSIVSSMTVDKYLEYCKVAYKAIYDEIEEGISDKDLYLRYADGRHEGLLDIQTDSEKEFADWLYEKHPKRKRGGHPWEIVRGGNFNLIGLRVMRPPFGDEENFTIELYGFSEHRAEKYLKIFLAIKEVGLPVRLNQSKDIRKRLTDQYHVGIIPNYESAIQIHDYFPNDEDVLSLVHYEQIKKYEEQLLPFIRWNHLPLLKPKY